MQILTGHQFFVSPLCATVPIGAETFPAALEAPHNAFSLASQNLTQPVQPALIQGPLHAVGTSLGGVTSLSPRAVYETRHVETHHLQFEADDVINFFRAPLITWLDRAHVQITAGPHYSPEPAQDPSIKLLQTKASLHREKVYAQLTANHNTYATNKTNNAAFDAKQTLLAMQQGKEYIYQTALTRGAFVGYVDLLVKVPNASGEKTIIGGLAFDYHYEPCVIKLAKHIKPEHVLKACLFAFMLESFQGKLPQNIRLINGESQESIFPTKHFYELALHYKDAFLEQQRGFNLNQMPALHRLPLGKWRAYVDTYLKRCQDVRIVNGLTETQAHYLNEAGILTISDLANSNVKTVPHMAEHVFQKIQLRARLIEKANNQQQVAHQLIDTFTDPARGLQTLPPKSFKQNDLFLSLQTSPLVENGLCYSITTCSYGANSTITNPKRSTPHTAWANNDTEEANNFSNLMANIRRRHQQDKNMHVYVYGADTIGRLRFLSQKHGLHEALLDNLIRENVFVDIKRIFKDSFETSSPSLELADLSSVLGINLTEEYRVQDSELLASIYFDTTDNELRQNANKRLVTKGKADTALLFRMYQFLHQAATDNQVTYHKPKKAPGPRKGFLQTFDSRSSEIPQKDTQRLIHSLWGRYGTLIKKYQNGENSLEAQKGHVALMMIQLLQYHIRETRTWFGRLYAKSRQTPEELVKDTAALGGMINETTREEGFNSPYGTLFTFGFPLQETKIKKDMRCLLSHQLKVSVTIHDIDHEEGRVTIRITKKMLDRLGDTMPKSLALIPYDYVSDQPLHDALFRLAADLNKQTPTIPTLTWKLLNRTPPEIIEWDDQKGTVGEPRQANILQSGSDNIVNESVQAITNMNQSVLCVQGVPGSGKTTLAALAIIDLIKQGKRVAVSGLTHKGMNQLAYTIAKLASEQKNDVGLRLVRVDDGKDQRDPRLAALKDKKDLTIRFLRSGDALTRQHSDFNVVVASPWVLARQDFKKQFSHVFIDEAGQLSIASATAISPIVQNMVLLGDHRQSEQPKRAKHPGLSGMSALEYMISGLGDNIKTLPPDFGLFLAQTHRMHPDITRFVSDAFYNGELTPSPATANQRIYPVTGLAERDEPYPFTIDGKKYVLPQAGLVAIPVHTQGHMRHNPEEVLAVRAIIHSLMHYGREYSTGPTPYAIKGANGLLASTEILVLSPYHAQNNAMLDNLEGGAPSTVDSSQGTENTVAIYSLAVSNPTSRFGAFFALNPRRLNTALTRAKTLAIVVGSPILLDARPATLFDMQNLNRWAVLLRHHQIQEV